jgi:hypothetical protein
MVFDVYTKKEYPTLELLKAGMEFQGAVSSF